MSGAHWDLEIGAISEINYRRKPSAALLFDDIAGYPRGYRVLTGSLSNARRMAVTLGLDPDLDTAGLVQALRGKPLRVGGRGAALRAGGASSRAPILENVVEGRDVDLTRFPAPLWHEHDGGRYIGTGVAVVTSDPDTRPDQRRRLPHDDPGGRPLGHRSTPRPASRAARSTTAGSRSTARRRCSPRSATTRCC